MFKFLDNTKKEYIRYFIKNKILTNLNYDEYDSIIRLLFILIEYIVLRFAIHINHFNDFWNLLIQNNNRDLITIFNLLYPYIDDELNYSRHKLIYNLEDISIKKNESINDQSKNNYLISNIQFNQYSDEYYKLSLDDININFNLLIETIERISNKLYVNWLNIRPLTLTNYKQSLLYSESIKLIKLLGNHNSHYDHIELKFNSGNLIYDVIRSIFIPFDELEGNENTLIDNLSTFDINSKGFKLVSKNLFKRKGISHTDIFNTIYNDLFFDIVKIKWLIYQDTFDNPNNDEIYIKKFNELIAVSGLYMNHRWDELTKSDQQIFIEKWNKFIDLASSYYYPNRRNGYFFLFKAIIIFFERNYSKIDAIVDLYNYQKITTDSDFNIIDDDDVNDDLEHSDAKTITGSELKDRTRKIPPEDIYNYFLDTIQKFILTWYGKNIVLFINHDNNNSSGHNKPGIHILGLDSIKFNYDLYSEFYIDKYSYQVYPEEYGESDIQGFDSVLPENLNLKYKFIYNYAKAFVIIYFNNKSCLRTNWSNMHQKNKKIMLELLNLTYMQSKNNMKKNINSFNKINVMSYANYYKRTYHQSPTFKDTSNGIGDYIGHYMYQYVRDKLIDIVFESHIMKGLLTEFVCDKSLTDGAELGPTYESKFNNIYNGLKNKVFTKDKLDDYKNNSFYFLTDQPYGNLYEIHRKKKKDYFELICSDYKWFNSYSMNWVSQINFFHRYINNRVIYVTGATGQGKSTQVPKLFLYCLKMIDRKNNGKIICSQPRISPTIDNSEQISYELGVPIFETSTNNNKKIKTFNPYVQYQTQDDSHKVEPHNGLLLKLVTDRLLYQELIKSPLFKKVKEVYNDNKTSDAVEYNRYTKENLYDIIMVDESHEHNLNMDLILSLARDTIKYNNSLKLVIVSATMTDDEPIYRRYYKEINDNFIHPYNFFNIDFNLDRRFVDRRIHISPPGETTQHKVDDRWLDYEPNSYPEAEKIAIERILKIASDPNSKGDILLFSLSAEDIRRICKYINLNLPSDSNFICLPFYRELPKKWNIFNDLSRKVRQITVNREDLIDEIYSNNSKIIKQVPIGTYQRTIIVATNIAEASITIDSLKYVIDTGYFISVSYNYIIGEPLIEYKKISNSSRIQRRGRVGRVGSGTVYYMYKNNSRAEIKSDLKINLEDISSELYDICPNKYNDSLLISSYDWTKDIGKLIDKKFTNDIFQRDMHLKTNNIFNSLILENYTYLNIILPSVINLVSKYDHHNINSIIKNNIDGLYFKLNSKNIFDMITDRPIRRNTGYNIKNDIFDIEGKFFIVHPDEQSIKRDILTGNLLEVNIYGKKYESSYIISPKIANYLNKCLNLNLFIDHEYQILNFSIFKENNKNLFDKLSFDFEKSVPGRLIQKLNSEFKIHEDKFINQAFIIAIIYSYICDTEHLIIPMILLLINSNFKLSNLNNNPNIFNNDSDLEVYYKLGKFIYENESKFISSLTNLQFQFEKDKEKFLKEKDQIMKNLKSKSNYWKLDINLELYEKFNVLYNSNRLNSTKSIADYVNESSKNIQPKVITDFIYLLNSLQINFDNITVLKFLKQYIDLKNKINKLINKYNIDTNTNDLLWFKYNFPINKFQDQFTNIKRAFITGFGSFNTVQRSDLNNDFESIKYDKSFKLAPDTLSLKSEMGVFLFCDTFKKNISIFINSDLDELAECNPYNYNPLLLSQTKINNNLVKKLLIIHSEQNKYKYINYLKTNYRKHPSFKNLFLLPNNYTEFLIKLWFIPIKSNTYDKPFNQSGGLIKQKYKLKLSKIPKIINKLNIDHTQFFDLLKSYNISYDNEYLILFLKN